MTDDRKARLAEALRANLKRRKAQGRGRAAQVEQPDDRRGSTGEWAQAQDEAKPATSAPQDRTS